MRQHPRLRRVSKWDGLASCVLIAAAWVMSLRVTSGCACGPAAVYSLFGCISCGWDNARHEPARVWEYGHEWSPGGSTTSAGLGWSGVGMIVPFGYVLASAALITDWLWHRDRPPN